MSDLCWQALRALPRWLFLVLALLLLWVSPQQLLVLLLAAALAWVWSQRSYAPVAGLSAVVMSLLAVVLLQQDRHWSWWPNGEFLLAVLAIVCGIGVGLQRRPSPVGGPVQQGLRQRPAQRSYRAILALFGILLIWTLIGSGASEQVALLLVLLLVAVELSGDAPRVLATFGIAMAALGVVAAVLGVDGPLVAAPLVMASVILAACQQQQRWRLMVCALLIGGAAVYYAKPWCGSHFYALAIPPAVLFLWWQLPGCGARLSARIRTLPPSWRWFVWAKRRWDPLRQQVLADPRPWKRILDAGCGWGLGGTLAWEHGGSESYVGIDMDPLKLAVAAHVLATAPLPVTLLQRQLPAAVEGHYDTIFAWDMLHYWPPAAQQEMLCWLRSHLHSDGVLWLREGLRDVAGAGRVTWGERWTTAIGLNPRGGLHFLSEEAQRQQFAAAGLRVCSCQASGGSNRLWELMVE